MKYSAYIMAFVMAFTFTNPASASEVPSPEDLQREQMEAEDLLRRQQEADKASGFYVRDVYETQDYNRAYKDADDAAIALEIAFSNLTEQWEANGYPDDIGGIYFDGEHGMMGILIVNPTQERTSEIQAMISVPAVFTPCAFTYNELWLAREEITTIIGSDSGIYGLGIGWTSTDGRVHGFGVSGKEFRLTVQVDESVFDHYRDGFALLYGDRVIVEVSGPIVDEAATEDNGRDMGTYIQGDGETHKSAVLDLNNPIVPVNINTALSWSAFYNTTNDAPNGNNWLWAVLGVMFAGFLLMWFKLRPVPIMQTTSGKVITDSTRVSKKQVVDAVKNSGATPSDGLFNSIIQKIDAR